MNKTSKFYLPQLDGLRFFAFFLVFIHHYPTAMSYFNDHTILHWVSKKIKFYGGWIGVDVFLCLSSFLLTTLLMMEHRNTGNLSIKQFFIRRALRIWPLYYFILILSFVIFPHIHGLSSRLAPVDLPIFVKEHLLPFSVFLGNISYAFYTMTLTTPIAPLWTVSLEEQFYLFWPILLFILLPRDRKWFFITLLGMVLFSLAVRFYIIKNHIPYPTIWVFSLGRLDPFALGALISYLYLNPKFSPNPLLALIFAIILFRLVIGSTHMGEPNTIWQMLAVDLASCALIYAAIHSRKLGKILSVQPLPWLGKISFGLYVFHDMMIEVTYSHILPHLQRYFTISETTLSGWCILLVIAFVATLACATLSYYSFEKHFLKLKTRFTVITSRPA